jgi:Vault protein inter-alpha-trypsin.
VALSLSWQNTYSAWQFAQGGSMFASARNSETRLSTFRKRKHSKKLILMFALLASSGVLVLAQNKPKSLVANIQQVTSKSGKAPKAKQNNESRRTPFQGKGSGTLLAMSINNKPLGECPLEQTDVIAKVSGYASHVTVKQTFVNPFEDKIEAVYTFPLSETGAVNKMVMRIGNRTILGTIKKREDAKQIYDAAKAAGHVASLLDQERPNIFYSIRCEY